MNALTAALHAVLPPHPTPFVPPPQVLPSSNDAPGVEGTGVGLAISKIIIESMGGQLRFTSEEGRGAVFTISVPLRKPPPRHLSPVSSTRGLSAAIAAFQGGSAAGSSHSGRSSATASFVGPLGGGLPSRRAAAAAAEESATREALINWASDASPEGAGKLHSPSLQQQQQQAAPGVFPPGWLPPDRQAGGRGSGGLLPTMSAPVGGPAPFGTLQNRAAANTAASGQQQQQLSENALMEGDFRVVVAVQRASLLVREPCLRCCLSLLLLRPRGTRTSMTGRPHAPALTLVCFLLRSPRSLAERAGADAPMLPDHSVPSG